MNRPSTAALLAATLTLTPLLPARAHADATPRLATSEPAPSGAAPAALAPGVPGELVTLPFVVPASGPAGQGFALGYENGLFGDGFGQGLRVRVPFSAHWGVVLRGLSVMDDRDDNQFDWSLGGRFEIFGQSPVFLNLVRLYGGGGVQLFRGMHGREQGVSAWGGGGQWGFEFFQSPRFSFFLEVGGQGGARQVSGATVLAGINIYPHR